jgi:hypothetical protein
VFVEYAVARAMSSVPDVVELRTVTGANFLPVSQFLNSSNVLGLYADTYSNGVTPASSAAARVKILNVEPACMPIVPPMPVSTL